MSENTDTYIKIHSEQLYGQDLPWMEYDSGPIEYETTFRPVMPQGCEMFKLVEKINVNNGHTTQALDLCGSGSGIHNLDIIGGDCISLEHNKPWPLKSGGDIGVIVGDVFDLDIWPNKLYNLILCRPYGATENIFNSPQLAFRLFNIAYEHLSPTSGMAFFQVSRKLNDFMIKYKQQLESCGIIFDYHNSDPENWSKIDDSELPVVRIEKNQRCPDHLPKPNFESTFYYDYRIHKASPSDYD